MKKFILAIMMSMALIGCTRIETGEVGLRVDMSKQVQDTELSAGSWNQTMIGNVITFPVRDVAVDVSNLTPLAADNSTMKDVDVSVIYSINPKSVSDLWINKSKSFHAVSDDGDILLMHTYMYQTARNAVFKVARNYEALNMNDSRAQIEQELAEIINKVLNDEELAGSITVSQVRIGSMVPSDTVKASADELVRAKNELKTKEVEVQTAKKEAERIAALNANAGAISYMNAQAQMKIADAILAGKVNTIVIPQDFKGIVNVK